MQWTDEAIVLGVKRHGETSVILELLTQTRGRHLGLVRGGVGTRLRGVLQPGNSLRATWRARLDEHLGNYVVEGLNLRAAGYLSAAHAVHGVTHLAALCRLLAERGWVVYLETSVAQQAERAGRSSHRPLLVGADPHRRLEELMHIREPLYREIADFIATTTRKRVNPVAERIVQAYRASAAQP